MTPHADTPAPDQDDPDARDPQRPAPDAAPRRRGPRRAVRRGTERETHWGVSTDESGGHGSNDERLRGDVPPHW
ncbi:hypothetical protein [Isoptericola sp. AK164]|uniref:hypothetical protein n=1 Tax=Isoptericola sp. AK164 TaxID=3024246 RepID=UPI0024189778|nr:hypothetical protein [Isoptericola sp. AK164]